MEQKPKRLKERFFERAIQLHRAWSTTECYWDWNVKFLRWHWQRVGGRESDWPKVDPVKMGRVEVEQYLTYLANERRVAPKTQNQAFSAILFLYNKVLNINIEGVNAMRAKCGTFIPTVLSMSEVDGILNALTGRNRLVAYLCYGAGLRIGEVFELRMKDVDWANNFIHIRQAKGFKDRIVQLPKIAIPLLRQQMEETERLYKSDVELKRAQVPLPYAYAKKSPKSTSDLAWYFVFSSHKFLTRTNNKQGYVGRWHLHSTTFTDELPKAVRRVQPMILKSVKSHTLRHSWATHLMNARVPLREIQELAGHANLETTSIYLHVEQNSAASNRSPLDSLINSSAS